MPELLIRHARLVDGTGAPARPADIAIDAGVFLDVAPAGSVDARLPRLRPSRGARRGFPLGDYIRAAGPPMG